MGNKDSAERYPHLKKKSGFVSEDDVLDHRWFLHPPDEELPKSTCKELNAAFNLYKSDNQKTKATTEFNRQKWTVDFTKMTMTNFLGMTHNIKRSHPTIVSYVIKEEDQATDFLNSNGLDSTTSQDLAIVWLRMQEVRGTPTWEWYNAEEIILIESRYQEYLSQGYPTDQCFPFCSAYVIDFHAQRQFKISKTGEVDRNRRRVIRRMLVIWSWLSNDQQWTPYSQALSYQLEYSYTHSQAYCDLIDYKVNLVSFTQQSIDNPKLTNRIMRQGPPLNIPFPSVVTIEDSSSNLEKSFLVQTSQVPSYWSGTTSGKIDPNSELFKRISKSINLTRANFNSRRLALEITEIELLQRPEVWRRYQVYKGSILCQNSGRGVSKSVSTQKIRNLNVSPKTELLDEKVNEFYLFKSISQREGKRRLSTSNLKYGVGVYFTDVALHANKDVICPNCSAVGLENSSCVCKDSGVVYEMILCRVILGDVFICTEKSWNSGDGLPWKDEKNQELGRFDSLFAVLGDYPESQTGLKDQEYVVYNNDCVYPEFVIRYKRKWT